jgi:hypothetical protein
MSIQHQLHQSSGTFFVFVITQSSPAVLVLKLLLLELGAASSPTSKIQAPKYVLRSRSEVEVRHGRLCLVSRYLIIVSIMQTLSLTARSHLTESSKTTPS